MAGRWEFGVPGTLALAIAILPACSDEGVRPITPTAPTSAASASGSNYLQGFVHDPVGRAIAGASVEILEGPGAGTQTIVDDRGQFAFRGGPTGAVTIRASQADFAPATTSARWSSNPNDRTRVVLKPLAPPLEVAPGAYTLTIISDPSATGWFGVTCEGFPPDLRRRTYDATISPASAFEGFQVRYTSPTLITFPGPFGFGFGLTQAGQFVGLELEVGFGSGPREELSGHRYVTISGGAPTSEPAAVTGESLTIPFWGTFEYCHLASPMGGYNACNQMPAAQRLEFYACSSQHDRIVFTRR